VGLKVSNEYAQKSSGNYFPNDADRSGYRDQSVTQQDLSSSLTGSIRPYKSYIALLNQSGTGNPIATVLENTLEVDIEWTRADVGVYNGASPLGIQDIFFVDNSITLHQFQIQFGFMFSKVTEFHSKQVIQVTTLLDAETTSDDILVNVMIEMKVFV
jgi:hypothetical protein